MGTASGKVVRDGFVANGPVDFYQYPLSGNLATCKRAANRELDIALALFGYAVAFGLMASPAILMVSDAGAQTPPATPATPSTETRSLVRNGVRNDARGVQNDAKSGATVGERDATLQPAPQDNQLMSKHRVLSLKPQLRLEWRGQDGQSETEQPDHSASLGNSFTSSTRIRFSVHTGGRSPHLPLA